MFLLAQTTDSLSSSTGLLILMLTGLIGVGVTGYRFWVNLRKTERGMSRERIQQANNNARSAQHEAYLWQARAADLEWLLRSNGHGALVPPLSEELKALVSPMTSTDVVDWNITDHTTGRNP